MCAIEVHGKNNLVKIEFKVKKKKKTENCAFMINAHYTHEQV